MQWVRKPQQTILPIAQSLFSHFFSFTQIHIFDHFTTAVSMHTHTHTHNITRVQIDDKPFLEAFLQNTTHCIVWFVFVGLGFKKVFAFIVFNSKRRKNVGNESIRQF